MDDKSLASFGLCLNARKAVVDKQMGADPTLPGPGAYVNPLTEGRNANGEVKATLSSQKTVPSVKFGTEGRCKSASSTLGPKYHLDNVTCGRQVQSKLRTAPSATFGRGRAARYSKRDDSPSPQHYDTQSLTNGVHKLSTQKSVPNILMTGHRADVHLLDTPAPGQYDSRSAIGRQIESKYMGGTSFTIKGRRREHARASKEPGPGHYIDPAKEGRNARGEAKAVLSHQKSYPSAVFSRARPASATAATGPPTHYAIPSTMGRQMNSKFRSHPSISFGVR
ncbi:hypothetical protein CTAYLR_009345 [Chrysophaeum taylorii]|uniref:Uncharacterized protein n=1 Tax=Chrysophaeum taylorii TaxID=2483200 RepID=A0AAD7UC85_9STRA|nr:hypothetical protein CTAYLR_009345 [Chrysophaeum taylorii]